MKALRITLLAAMSLAAPLLAQGGGGPPGGGPPAVPPVPTPPQNPITEAKRVLGKILFWDEQLSSDNTMACGTCHLTEIGGADPRPANHPGPDGLLGTADDIRGSRGVVRSDENNDYVEDANFGFAPGETNRYAQTFMGGLWSPTQFWDGRANGTFVDPDTGLVTIPAGGSLENQVLGPPLSDVEMAHESRDWDQITAKLADVKPLALATDLPIDMAVAIFNNPDGYPALFQNAFGSSEITAQRIAFAIATYERTLVADQTPWDAFNNGQQNALTQNQLQGLNFFANSVCSQCHQAPLFSDNQFHNIGLRPWQEDDGRRGVTGNFGDRGSFKTPSLRNVGLRTRLMHNGRITSVADALNFYRSGVQAGTGHVQFNDGQDPRVRNIAIPPNVLPALNDFLTNALTDPRVANGTFPFDRPTLLGERQADRPEVFGAGFPGTGGFVPQILANNQMVTNNPDFRVGVANGLGGAPAALLLALDRSAPGTMFGSVPIHVDLAQFVTSVPLVLTGAAPGSGVATWKLPIGDDPGAVGLQLTGQWLVADPISPQGVSSSSGATWTVF